MQGSTTQFFLTDALGSVITTFNATAGSAAVQGNQVYGPYGTSRYNKGTMGTTKGFTGQYADATGLDYYNARYYDPVIGQFLSADVKQGDLQGMNPYGYVGGNPETLTDPTGEFFAQGDDNGMVQNTGRLSNTTTADGGSGISVVTENVNTGRTTRTVVPIKKPVQPVVSGGSHSNPKMVTQPATGCGVKCTNANKNAIRDFITKQQERSQNQATLVGDSVAAMADVVSIISDVAGSAWAGAIVDLLSLIVHGAAILVDLQNLGVKLTSFSANIMSWIGVAKYAINIIDEAKGVLDLFSLGGGLKKIILSLIPENKVLKIVSGIADAVAGSTSSGAGIFNNVQNATYYNNAFQAVDRYDDQQAHDVCVQDYGAEAAAHCF